MKRMKNPIPDNVLKVLVVVEVMGAAEVLTHEPGAVAGAFATTLAALWYRLPVESCLGR
jgi:hypothetical protein